MQCPFCLSNIPEEAIVCRFCTRDIGKLLDARREIEELKQKLAEITPETSPALSGHVWNKWIVLLQYVIAAIVFNLLIYQEGNLRDILIYSSTAIAGLGIMILNPKSTNIWVLFILGFCEPMVYLTSYKIFRGTNVDLLAAFSGYIFDAFITGALMTSGGFFAALSLPIFNKEFRLSKDNISFEHSFKWISAGHSVMGTFEDLMLKIVSLLTAAAALAKAMGKI
jgi:hypothetical protein